MPRANRFFLPGHAWHITHRCHKQEFLLKFAKDRKRWRYWLFEARKRYGLSILNFCVTSNHVHLLVHDHGTGEIAKSMQLIAGRTAQEYNNRKQRKGAYWEDRYHATAIDTEQYLARCMVYIDLNMVRAGVVAHPDDWRWCGYHEIQHPAQRYTVIDTGALLNLFGTKSLHEYRQLHKNWVDTELRSSQLQKEPMWSQGIAVGGEQFVTSVQSSLSIAGQYRTVIEDTGLYVLKQPLTTYAIDFGV